MSTPLSKYWVVEYHFYSDTFDICSLPHYLTRSHKAFKEHKPFDSVLMGIHPSKQGAEDEFAVWVLRKDKAPTTLQERLTEFRGLVKKIEELVQTEEKRRRRGSS